MPLAASTTVTYQASDPRAVAVVGSLVVARLIGMGDRADGSVVVLGVTTTTTDGSGSFSLLLVPNSAYRQTGTYYEVSVARGPTYAILVPVSATAVSLWDIRVDPASLEPVPVATPPLYLLRTELGAPLGAASLGADGLLAVAQRPPGGGGTTDHGALTGLGDDDHPQYHNDTRGDARYYTKTQVDTSLAGKSAVGHVHAVADTTGLQAALDGKEAAGTAAASMATHVAASDPHPGYLTPAEGNAAYSALGHAHAQADVTGLVADLAAKVPTSRTVTAGTGLTGGGDLSANRTLAADFGTSAGKVTEGNDSRVTGALQASLVDAKGDLLVATAADTVGRLAAGADGRVLLADASQAGGLRWTTRPRHAYDPAMDGLVAVAADPVHFRGASPLGTAGWAARVLVLAGTPITGGLTCLATAGTVGAGGVNGFGLHDDDGALVTSTTDDNNLWATAGPRSKAFPSVVAAQSADRYVYVGVRLTGYTVPPAFDFADGTSGGGRLDGLLGGKRRSLVLGGSAWGTIDPVAGSSGSGYMPLLALY